MKASVVMDREQAAHDAFEAHRALVRAERADPRLARNEYWRALRDAAKARFLAAFEAA